MIWNGEILYILVHEKKQISPFLSDDSNIPLPGSPCRGLCCTAATGELLDNERLQKNDGWPLGLGLCILMTHT